MRVLVTGGAGFVGRPLVSALLQSGYEVRVLDALLPQVHPEGVPPASLSGEAEFIVGDVRDASAVASALEGVDAVVHLAAEVGVGQSMYEIPRFVHANSLGTAVLLQEIVERRSAVRRLVVASSMTGYGEGAGTCPRHGHVAPGLRPEAQLEARQWETTCPHCGSPVTPAPTAESQPPAPTSVYAVTKQNQEELCLTVGRAYGIPVAALRFFNIYGPGQSLTNPYTGVISIFSNRILSGEAALLYEDGRQSRDFVHVQDIVQAVTLVLQSDSSGCEVFNVSSGELWSVLDVARMVAEELGAPDRVQVTGRFRAGDIRHCHGDITLIRARLGYEPRFGLRAGLPEVVQWAREEHSRASRAGADLHQASRELERYNLVR